MRRTLVFLILLPFALAPPAQAKAELGTPTVGDFWETHATAAGTDANSRLTIAAIETLTIGTASHQAARAESFSNRSFSAGAITTTTSTELQTWTRLSDGAALRTTTRTSSPPPFPGAPGHESTSETTYSAPCLHYEFPLVVGKSWSRTCHSTTRTTSSGSAPTTSSMEETTQFRVLREESVTVPAGTFEALVIEMNATYNGSAYVSYQWYAPRACTAVKTASDIDGFSISSELVAFQCADTGAYTPGEGSEDPAVGTPAATASGTPPTTTAPPTTPPSPTPTTEEVVGLPGPAGAAIVATAALIALALGRRGPR